ncbi:MULTISPECIES: glycosyltransferase family 2 protein [unclassified Prochlorococcus]|nr:MULTISPECIES: glycosyltransferase [unclassified Prochlorococcus]
MHPHVSIVIPAYNSQSYIEACINSCIMQETEINYEVVVCDDASTDSTNEILGFLYSDNKLIKIITNTLNVGVGFARNKAISMARGRYIFLLDSDDYIHPLTIQTLTVALELRPDIDIVYSDYVYVDDNDQKSSRINACEKPIACARLVRKSVFARHGLYESLRIGEEREFASRLNANGINSLHLPLPLYRYRQHSMSLTSEYEQKRTYDKSHD